MNLAIKVPIEESEAGWGRKIDDWMVCLTKEDAKAFEVEYNKPNVEDYAKTKTVPSWYMQADASEAVEFDITDKQVQALKESKNQRMYLSSLKKII